MTFSRNQCVEAPASSDHLQEVREVKARPGPLPRLTWPRLLAAWLAATLANLLLNAAGYALVLKDFYAAHPAGSPEFVRQLNRSPSELLIWALLLSAFAMGLLVTWVMSAFRPNTFAKSLGPSLTLGFLFWTSVNFALYSSSHLFSLASILIDTPLSSLSMASSAMLSCWVLRGCAQDEQASP